MLAITRATEICIGIVSAGIVLAGTRPLQAAMEGLFAALSGWRIIANHLPLLPGQQAARETAAIRRLLPVALRSVQPEKDAARW